MLRSVRPVAIFSVLITAAVLIAGCTGGSRDECSAPAPPGTTTDQSSNQAVDQASDQSARSVADDQSTATAPPDPTPTDDPDLGDADSQQNGADAVADEPLAAPPVPDEIEQDNRTAS